MLPHLDAAYTLARWITGNVQDAEDAVQEAYLRALRFFNDFRGDNARAWLLQIVRNTCYTRMRNKFPQLTNTPFEEDIHSEERESQTPETVAIASADIHLVRHAIQELPLKYREVLILRELEDMSYMEVAKVTSMTLGTVRSTLFRARRLLRQRLGSLIKGNIMQPSAPVQGSGGCHVGLDASSIRAE
jgi:RNA polymerase sigma-70 factor (ECF subfamily)